MKKILTFALLCSLVAFTSCIPDEDDDLDWVDSTTHVFDYWTDTPVNIFYIGDVPIISDTKLTTAEADSLYKSLTYTNNTYYSATAGEITGTSIIDQNGATRGFVYYDTYYRMNCLVAYLHVNNTGKATTYIYRYSNDIDSSEGVYEDTLEGTIRYAQENDHWVFEMTKITLDGNVVWSGGNETAVVLN